MTMLRNLSHAHLTTLIGLACLTGALALGCDDSQADSASSGGQGNGGAPQGTGGSTSGTGGAHDHTGHGGEGTGGGTSTETGVTLSSFTESDWALAYFAEEDIGLDARNPVSVVMTKDGLESYDASDLEQPTVGTAKHADAKTNGTAIIGKWTDGDLGGKFYSAMPTFGPGEGFHYTLMKDVAGDDEIQSGEYALKEKTGATWNDTATPDLVSASVTFTGGSEVQIGFSLTINDGADDFTATAPDTVAVPYESQMRVNADATTTACGSAMCQVSTIFYQSADGETVTMIWQTGGPDRMGGAAILEKK